MPGNWRILTNFWKIMAKRYKNSLTYLLLLNIIFLCVTEMLRNEERMKRKHNKNARNEEYES